MGFKKGNKHGRVPKEGKGTGRKPCEVNALRTELVNDPASIRKAWAKLVNLCEHEDPEIAMKAVKYRLSLVFPEQKEMAVNLSDIPEPFVWNFPPGFKPNDLDTSSGNAEP